MLGSQWGIMSLWLHLPPLLVGWGANRSVQGVTSAQCTISHFLYGSQVILPQPISSVSLSVSSLLCCCGYLSCHSVSVLLFTLAQSLHAEAETSMSVAVVFSVELLTQWLWAHHWQVGGVTVPSVWPRGPSAMQVTSALIWLISLMSLFLGGPTNECDLNQTASLRRNRKHRFPGSFWPTYSSNTHTQAHTHCLFTVKQHKHTHT